MCGLKLEIGMGRRVLSYSVNLTSVELMLGKLGVTEVCGKSSPLLVVGIVCG